MQEQQIAPRTSVLPIVMTMGGPATTEQIEVMPIGALQANFFALMDEIVTAYGDKADGASGKTTNQEAQQ